MNLILVVVDYRPGMAEAFVHNWASPVVAWMKNMSQILDLYWIIKSV